MTRIAGYKLRDVLIGLICVSAVAPLPVLYFYPSLAVYIFHGTGEGITVLIVTLIAIFLGGRSLIGSIYAAVLGGIVAVAMASGIGYRLWLWGYPYPLMVICLYVFFAWSVLIGVIVFVIKNVAVGRDAWSPN